MNVHYTGGQGEFTAAQKAKLEGRFKKIAKLIDGKGEKEAHVILVADKRQKKAEVTVNYLHHSLVSAANGPAYLPALTAAVDKLEKQILKLRTKRRDVTRKETAAVKVKQAEPAAPPPPRTKVHPAKVSKKPMTVMEGTKAIKKDANYIAFRDADTGGISILIRRADGDFDLVQS